MTDEVIAHLESIGSASATDIALELKRPRAKIADLLNTDKRFTIGWGNT